MNSNLFTNNASALLANPLAAGATSLQVGAGQGAMFPRVLANGDYFYLTLTYALNGVPQVWERVLVTAVAGDVFTIVRGQDGSTAQMWVAGTTVELRLTAAGLRLFAPLASPSFTGTPTAPTPAINNSSTSIANTAFVATAVATETTRAEAAEALLAPIASPTFTGAPQAPTPAQFDKSNTLATTNFAWNLGHVFTGVFGLTTNTTLTSTQANGVIDVQASSLTITLPSLASCSEGTTYTFRASGFSFSLQGNGTDKIVNSFDAALGNILFNHGEVFTVVRNVDSWYIAHEGFSLSGALGNPSQSWQNMTASRQLGQTYTNMTNAPIEVAVVVNSGTGANTYLTLAIVVGGAPVMSTTVTSPGATIPASVLAIVPVGVTYYTQISGNSGGSLYSFCELR